MWHTSYYDFTPIYPSNVIGVRYTAASDRFRIAYSNALWPTTLNTVLGTRKLGARVHDVSFLMYRSAY